jgi:hypothetical protein
MASHASPRCHAPAAAPSACQETTGQAGGSGQPEPSGNCGCTQRAAHATLIAGGAGDLNLAPILQAAAMVFHGQGAAAALTDSPLRVDPRNTTGPPVLRGASAQAVFCHFTI